MFEYALLGAIQGIAEWLPISSEGTLVLAQTILFGGAADLGEMIRVALFLHLGSLLSVLVYFRKDILALIRHFFSYPHATREERAPIHFLVIATLVSGVLGYIIYLLIEEAEAGVFQVSGAFITIGIGLFLIVTAGLQYAAQRLGEKVYKTMGQVSWVDALILGVVQACAVLPGLSRSGTTIPALLLRKVSDTDALKLSFFMSIPIILMGNIVLNFEMVRMGIPEFTGLVTAFIFGTLTIHGLMKLAARWPFAVFTFFFGILTLTAGVISFWF